ncbi:MAG: hypothetical protein ACI8V2_000860 [Candidatus Latescibacterota bacterium]|jgi:hypothetical protein
MVRAYIYNGYKKGKKEDEKNSFRIFRDFGGLFHDDGQWTVDDGKKRLNLSSIVHRQPSIVYFLRFWEIWGT